MGRTIDLTGKRFGRLTVLGRDENRIGDPRYLCVCSCPRKTRKVILGYSLTTGKTRSCGCIRKEQIAERSTKRHVPGITDEELRALYIDQELSSQEISDRLGVTPPTVRTWLKAAGIPIRSLSEAAALSGTARNREAETVDAETEDAETEDAETVDRDTAGHVSDELNAIKDSRLAIYREMDDNLSAAMADDPECELYGEAAE
jgi:hypothetical protein